MKQRTRSKRSIGGFTLIEMLVVIIVIGVLFAIAAPGWDTILSRQRVSAAREQITQTIRVAQSDARRSRSPRAVVFDMSTASKPRIANVPYIPDNTQATASRNTVLISGTSPAWLLLGNGDGSATTDGNVSARTVKLAVTNAATNAASSYPVLIFDGNGAIAQTPLVPATQTLPITITVSRGNTTGRATDRCVVVQTLLGAIRTEEGTFNAGTGKGCPP